MVKILTTEDAKEGLKLPGEQKLVEQLGDMPRNQVSTVYGRSPTLIKTHGVCGSNCGFESRYSNFVIAGTFAVEKHHDGTAWLLPYWSTCRRPNFGDRGTCTY